MSVLPCDKILSRPGSAGLPVPGGRFKIVEGEEQEPLCGSWSGAVLSHRFLWDIAEGASSLSLGDINRGILFTGDLGYIEDGFFIITPAHVERQER